ncbi:hypothetical protein D043_2444B, partial [Vibrio parahaemolyticus EKP-021]
GRRMKARLEAI